MICRTRGARARGRRSVRAAPEPRDVPCAHDASAMAGEVAARRQRLRIARAFLKDARVLILGE